VPTELFLGVEGGATRTTGVVTDDQMRVLARAATGPTNVHAVGEAAARGALLGLFAEVLVPAGARLDSLAGAAFCIAGVRGDADRRQWRRILNRLGVRGPAVITHDAAAGLAAGSPDQTGVLVVCGTGSLVYGRRADGAERFVGGRGPILGDEGSGFDIGQRGLRAAIRSSDGRGEPTALERLIPERLALSGLDELVGWVSPFARDRVAAVAPVVFEAAVTGDQIARSVVEAAVGELASSVAIAARYLWPPPAQLERVVFWGGVLRNQPLMRDALAEAVRAFAPGAACGLPEVDGAVGAARLARRAAANNRPLA